MYNYNYIYRAGSAIQSWIRYAELDPELDPDDNYSYNYNYNYSYSYNYNYNYSYNYLSTSSYIRSCSCFFYV